MFPGGACRRTPLEAPTFGGRLPNPPYVKPGSAPAEHVDAPIYKIRKWKIKRGLLLSEITQTVQKLIFRLD